MPAEIWLYGVDGKWRSNLADAYSLRDNLVYGTYRPDANTTGIVGSVDALTVHSGNLTTTTAGQVIENLRITGKLTIKHANVTVRNCLLEGLTAGATSPSYSSITAYQTIIGAASTTSAATLRVPHGTAPSAPVDGDMWTTTSGAYIRVNGVTKQIQFV